MGVALPTRDATRPSLQAERGPYFVCQALKPEQSRTMAGSVATEGVGTAPQGGSGGRLGVRE